jgi:hypothetical protein
MIENSTLFYILDNTDTDESMEIQGKLLEMQIKDLLDWDQNLLFEVSKESTDKVMSLLR